MSSSSQGPRARGESFGSGYTLPSRQLPVSDPLISKRVCFYKSGDYTFNGHRMVINVRTFKTFDALLDALAKKVPLAFGVRTITTPRGVHYVKSLDDLFDGGSYVCSDQKRVKPLNLTEISRRQVPWNTTRPVSARRRRRGVIIGPTRKVTESVAVRTPKRLEVIKNRDPSVKRTIILQKRTAPTFDALLDYLSQVLQFPVLKLYSTEGRRVDGLAALILCSGVVVAAGNEPFRLGGLRLQRRSQMAQATLPETSEASIPQPLSYNKPSWKRKTLKNISPSSEHFIVHRINQSKNGNLHSGPVDPDTTMETCIQSLVEKECHTCIVPQDEDIEKSFRVNPDGSMTVEMKVRLKIKEEEMLHWTTTLSRSTDPIKRIVYPMVSGSANSSPDCNNSMAKRYNFSEEESKEANLPAANRSSVGFIKDNVYDSPEVIERKSICRRAPTPGPTRMKKKAVMIDSEVQELDRFTYMKRTSDNDTTEEYHVVRHSSSRSNHPIPKPRKNTSNDGVAEVLKVEHNGFGVTEKVVHIYDGKGSCDSHFVDEECDQDRICLDGSSPAARQSSNNDCDIDCSWQPPVVDPVQKEEILSLSSEPLSTSCRITNNLSSVTDNLAKTMPFQEDSIKVNEADKKKKVQNADKRKSLKGSSDKKQSKVTDEAKSKKKTSSDKLSTTSGFGKKTSTDMVKSVQKNKVAEKAQVRKNDGNKASKEKIPETQQIRANKSANKIAAYNGHNVNVPDIKTATNKMKKSISDILRPNKSLPQSQKTLDSKSRSVNKRARSPKKSAEVSEASAIIPSVNPSPSEVHQYVEDWLEKVSPEAVPYTDEDLKSQSKVEFQLGDDSDGENKNDSRLYVEGNCTSNQGTFIYSNSTLSVPPHQSGPMQGAVSMPSIRACQDAAIKPYKSAADINCDVSSSKDRLQPLLRQICSSVQCIHRASNNNTMPNLAKSTSLPDFPSQVASVFGSSCKAFLSFLSMVTLRDSLTGFAPSHGNSPLISSEAMLMMESLQKISTIDNEKKQRASLSDLQSQASEQLKEQWQDYQIKRGWSESDLRCPKLSESGANSFCQNSNMYCDQRLGIGELMDELNMPTDLRAEISSVIQEAIHFYPTCENVFEQNRSAIEDMQTDVRERLREDAELEEKSHVQMAGIEDRGSEGTDGENLETENSDVSLKEDTSLKSQRTEETNKENETDDAGQVLEEISGEETSVGDEGAEDSAAEEQESIPTSEKSDKEIYEDAENKEDSDSDHIQCRNGAREETERDSCSHEEKQKHAEDDAVHNAAENIGGRESARPSTTDGANETAEREGSVMEALLNQENSSCDLIESGEEGVREETSQKSSVKYSSEDGCIDEICDGESGGKVINLVEISQDLLDFVNSALLSSSLIFTYDSLGNVKVEPNIKLTANAGRDSAYGFNCLPSPNTSELTDYRPESEESGGYITQDSLDIVTDSEDLDKPFPVCRHSAQRRQEISNEVDILERVDSKLSHSTCKSKTSLSSHDSGAKVSREDLSCFSAASSLKADNEHAPETEQCVSSVPGKHSPDGVLIDQGRWLLKENHLIRKSPPVSLGMYAHLDNTSYDTSLAEDSPSHYRAQANPLAALSSSELEEMARPLTPKCTYYNMPHGSDSDPFLDAASVKSEKNAGRHVKVEAQVDTTKTWANKNGSLSSFASVEFKMPDRKVHPEGESSAGVQTRRTSSGEQRVVQAQDSGETLRGRCHQYCPIL